MPKRKGMWPCNDGVLESSSVDVVGGYLSCDLVGQTKAIHA